MNPGDFTIRLRSACPRLEAGHDRYCRALFNDALTRPTVVQLADYAAWDTFAEANADALIAEYGSVEFALQLCIDGGITLGGGAAPEFLICFED
jgi:hypothetical protein